MVESAIMDIVGNEKTPSLVSWVVKNAIMDIVYGDERH